MRRIAWALVLMVVLAVLAVLAGCGRPMSLEQAKNVAISVAHTGYMVPPRRMEDMTALLAARPRSDSPHLAAWRAAADAQPPAGASPGALAEFYRERGEAAWELGRSRQARDDFAAAYAQAMAAGRSNDPRLLNMLARSEEIAGNLRRALELLETLPPSSPNPGLYARMLRLHLKLGNLSAARTAQEQGLAIAARKDPRGEKPGVIKAVADLRASLAEGLGRWQEAEPHIRKLLDLMSIREEKPSEVLQIRLRLTRNLQNQGRLVDAEVEARQAVRDAAAADGGDPGFLAQAAHRLGEVALAQGRLAEARDLSAAIVTMLEGAGYAPESAHVLNALNLEAKAKTLLEDFAGASADFDAILARIKGNPDQAGRATGNNPHLPLALLLAGRPADALGLAQGMYARLKQVLGPDAFPAAQMLAIRGAAQARLGQDREALADLSRAMPVLLSRSGTGSANEGQAIRTRILAGEWLALLVRLQGSALAREAGLDPLEESFRAAESAGSRAVRGALAAQGARAAGQDPELAEMARQEQDLAMYLEAAQADLLAQAGGEGGQLDAARKHVAELYRARQALLEEIGKRFPRYSALVAPQGCSLRQVQESLRPGEALVSVFPAQDQTFVWCVPARGEPSFHAASVGRKELAKRVEALRLGLEISASTLAEVPAFDLAQAHALYRDLLGPAEAGFKDAATLLAVLRPPLDRLPLGVLVTAATDPGPDRAALFDRYRRIPWLAVRQAVAVVPSAESLRGLRAMPPGEASRKPLAGFGDPFFSPEQARLAAAETPGLASRGVKVKVRSVRAVNRGSLDVAGVQADLSQLDRLPDTRDELLEMAAALGADAKADLFLGRDAARSKVLAMELRDRRVLAFATHALVPGDLDGLDQPALALSASLVTGVAGDGLLTMEDVLRLRLAADWVVLSACNTGAADGAGAEAVSGLGRAFFYAGARALLVSMWPVETTSARRITTGLFAVQAKEPGLSRAEALRRSMLDLMNGPSLAAEDGRKAVFAHPFFWAPFVLVGETGGAAR